MRWGPRVCFAHTVERWYFGSPASIFPFLGILSQIFPFLGHFCYMLRNGLENRTCFIPLGKCFLNILGDNTIFLPKIDWKWARNNCPFLEFLGIPLGSRLRPTRSLRSRSGNVVFWESCFHFFLFLAPKLNFCLKIWQFFTLKLHLFHSFGQKTQIKTNFFWKLDNFLPLYSISSQFLTQNSTFVGKIVNFWH